MTVTLPGPKICVWCGVPHPFIIHCAGYVPDGSRGSALKGMMAVVVLSDDDGNARVSPDGVVTTRTRCVAVVSGKLPLTDRIKGCTSVAVSTLPHGLLTSALVLQPMTARSTHVTSSGKTAMPVRRRPSFERPVLERDSVLIVR